MTAPGEPIELHSEHTEYQQCLTYYAAEGFVDLAKRVEAVLINAAPAENECLWYRPLRGQTPRGWIATFESKDLVFQVMYVAVNDKRTPLRLVQGTYTAAARARFIKACGGISVQGDPK